MQKPTILRTRAWCVLLIIVVVTIGLYARSHRSTANPETVAGFLATYTGDTMWSVMFFLMGRFAFPSANRWVLLAATLALTLTIEFGQLWQPPTLQWLRQKPVSGFLLGNSFVWSDVICLLVGGGLAILFDLAIHAVTTLGSQRVAT